MFIESPWIKSQKISTKYQNFKILRTNQTLCSCAPLQGRDPPDAMSLRNEDTSLPTLAMSGNSEYSFENTYFFQRCINFYKSSHSAFVLWLLLPGVALVLITLNYDLRLAQYRVGNHLAFQMPRIIVLYRRGCPNYHGNRVTMFYFRSWPKIFLSRHHVDGLVLYIYIPVPFWIKNLVNYGSNEPGQKNPAQKNFFELSDNIQ